MLKIEVQFLKSIPIEKVRLRGDRGKGRVAEVSE
jgi:hypothetical protein